MTLNNVAVKTVRVFGLGAFDALTHHVARTGACASDARLYEASSRQLLASDGKLFIAVP